YDVRGRRTKLTEPKVGALVTHYSAFGDVIDEQDAAGILTTYTSDALGRELTLSNNKDGLTRFVWDTAPNGVGALATVTNERSPNTSADDIATAYGYDALGRMTQETLNLDGAF